MRFSVSFITLAGLALAVNAQNGTSHLPILNCSEQFTQSIQRPQLSRLAAWLTMTIGTARGMLQFLPFSSSPMLLISRSPRVTAAPAATSTPAHDDHHDEHTTTVSNSAAAEHSAHDDHGNLSPSPTESVGCVAHGNHWDCDGPASTGSIITSVVPSATAAAGNVTGNSTISGVVPVETGAAVSNGVSLGLMAGLVGVVAILAL
jgi:hypothetical protein